MLRWIAEFAIFFRNKIRRKIVKTCRKTVHTVCHVHFFLETSICKKETKHFTKKNWHWTALLEPVSWTYLTPNLLNCLQFFEIDFSDSIYWSELLLHLIQFWRNRNQSAVLFGLSTVFIKRRRKWNQKKVT